MIEAPERIRVSANGNNIVTDNPPWMGDVHYFREDVAQAMVAAVYEDLCVNCCGTGKDIDGDDCDHGTPKDALAALDRVKAEARKQERRAIFDRITDYIDGAPCDGINAEGEFSEAVWLSQRKFIDGMRQARAAASPRAAAIRSEADKVKT